MAVEIGNTLHFITGCSFELDRNDLDIRVTANGFVVTKRKAGDEGNLGRAHVFTNAAAMAAWIRKEYTPKIAKKAKKPAKKKPAKKKAGGA
jgi:hypothetical protein